MTRSVRPQCQREGFGGFFDGEDDYVTLPDLGEFDAVSMEAWVQFDEISGEHPVVMEDGWDAGAIHLQILGGNFVLGINGVGDYKFGWQPEARIWYFVSVQYGTKQNKGTISLSVNNELVDDASKDMGGSFTVKLTYRSTAYSFN
jgi:hypothetical protein